MAQLITDPLTTPGGRTFGPAGVLLDADDRLPLTMADELETLLRDPSMYVEMSRNARGRVENFFQLEDAMGAYNRLYKEIAGIPINELEAAEEATRVIDLTERPVVVDVSDRPTVPQPRWPRRRGAGSR